MKQQPDPATEATCSNSLQGGGALGFEDGSLAEHPRAKFLRDDVGSGELELLPMHPEQQTKGKRSWDELQGNDESEQDEAPLACDSGSSTDSSSCSTAPLQEAAPVVPDEDDDEDSPETLAARRTSVRFSVVQVQEYAITLGDHPYTETFPLSLDWRHTAAQEHELEDYEALRRSITSNSDRSWQHLTSMERRVRLAVVGELNPVELAELERERQQKVELENLLFEIYDVDNDEPEEDDLEPIPLEDTSPCTEIQPEGYVEIIHPTSCSSSAESQDCVIENEEGDGFEIQIECTRSGEDQEEGCDAGFEIELGFSTTAWTKENFNYQHKDDANELVGLTSPLGAKENCNDQQEEEDWFSIPKCRPFPYYDVDLQ